MRRTQLHAARWHSQPWYETNSARLLLERKAMEMRFPAFRLIREGSTLLWNGTLTTPLNNRYEIVVGYPDNFPVKPPDVLPVNPEVTVWKDELSGRLMHQFSDGRLCLHYPGDRAFAQNTTAAAVVAVAGLWFFAYEAWLASGKKHWPGPSAD